MSVIYGLIDAKGQILNQKGYFNVKVVNKGKDFIADFQQDMQYAVVVASPRFFKENYRFDHHCTPIVVSNAPDGNRDTIGFSMCKLENNCDFGFSFVAYPFDLKENN